MLSSASSQRYRYQKDQSLVLIPMTFAADLRKRSKHEGCARVHYLNPEDSARFGIRGGTFTVVAAGHK